jgi:ribonuclease R
MAKKNKKSKLKDPHAAREARRYAEPIPSREAIIAFLTERQELMKMQRLATGLGLQSEQELIALERRLSAMVRDGQLIRNRREGFGVAERLELIPGRIQGHGDGFGFLIPDAGGDDLYLSAKEMRQVLHADRVLARVVAVDRRGRLEGTIVEVLERTNSHLVGRFHKEAGVGVVVADEKRISQDILIPPDASGKAESGDFVYLEILEQPTRRRQPVGRVLEVFGRNINAPMATDVAIYSHDIPFEWPAEASRAARDTADHVLESETAGRKDFRSLALVTIDGADAKDFDDAVWCEQIDKGGFRLIVAIADVAHYVTPGSALDREAQHRGTSVYFPNRVVPMLPERLSNGICSLKPKVDRLCMACEIRFDAGGKSQRTRFFNAVMHSHARLTYDQAWEYLDGKASGESLHLDPASEASLRALHGLYKARRKRREKRGALDFDSREVGFRFDEHGEVAEIVARDRNDAHKLIEECMIAANIEAARWLERQELPALYRVHASPPEQKLEDLRQSLAELGLFLPVGEDVKPVELMRILKSVADRPDRELIQALVLRSQSLAAYQPENKGHFGLALQNYAHFTSPIRRYPDLLVHRAIKHALDRGKADSYHYNDAEMASHASHCSMTERRAEEASRDVDGRLKCAYMRNHIGEEFDGVVTGATAFGLFVELAGLHISGLVHVTMLPNDYYHFDPVTHTLTGERRRRIYRLADRVRVQVVRVDVDEREVDLKLIEADQ